MQTRQRPRNVRFDYGPVSDAELTPSQKFRITSYIPVIDQFVVSLAHRLSAYEELCSRFGFLAKLESLSTVEIESSADNLVIVYKDDLEQCFGNELACSVCCLYERVPERRRRQHRQRTFSLQAYHIVRDPDTKNLR